MTPKSIGLLAALVVLLVVAAMLTTSLDDPERASMDHRFLPEFEHQADGATRVRITGEGQNQVSLARDGKHWLVRERDNYPADIGKLRALFIALAKARVVEEKTSNPEYYEKLGVDDPDAGGDGNKVVIEGDGLSYTVLLGHPAQSGYRYARIGSDQVSYLIDQNPDVSADASAWLDTDLLDLAADSVRTVSIHHSDGEAIQLKKESKDETNFTLLKVPEGREPTYPGVASGIAGALDNLQLEDVRKAHDEEASTTTTFETWDGLTVSLEISESADHAWLRVAARQADREPVVAADDSDDSPATDSPSASTSAATINARLAGWQYRIADYKKNLLTRRWADLLKARDEDSGDESH